MSAHTIVSATCHNGVLTTRYANDDFDVAVVDLADHALDLLDTWTPCPDPECESCGQPLYSEGHHLCGSCQDMYEGQENNQL